MRPLQAAKTTPIHRANLIEYSLLVRSSIRVAFCLAVCGLALDSVLGRIETRYCTTDEGLRCKMRIGNVAICSLLLVPLRAPPCFIHVYFHQLLSSGEFACLVSVCCVSVLACLYKFS